MGTFIRHRYGSLTHAIEAYVSVMSSDYTDQCTGSNPRMPLVSEIANIYRKAYGE
ncbi:hypothetical protein [Thermoanaerobacter kivui]|uniref:hypothetical protein n=1 Tax=Thermoanaerobacter kivui TaxID=2325 RepID=UPI00130D92C8